MRPPSTLRTRLTFANVVSMLALFVALGGSSYAALTITGKDVKNSSLTTRDVKNRSLLGKDFKRGQLPTGAQGPQGPEGPAGSAGVRGQQGEPGTAFAYARVNPDGTVDLAHSKNFTQANITNSTSAPGLYCLDPPTGTKSVIVSPESRGGLGSQVDHIVTYEPGNQCGGGFPDRIYTYDVSSGYLDAAFTIWLED